MKIHYAWLLISSVLLASCSTETEEQEKTETVEETSVETETTEDTVDEPSEEPAQEPADPEPSPQPDAGDPVDCSEPLSLSPEFPKVNIWKNVDFQYSGGSGEYRFRIEEPAHDAQINQENGRLMAGGTEDVTLTVTMLDELCETEQQATIDIIGAFISTPSEGLIPTGTSFSIEAANAVGAVTCTEALNGSGFTLNGCDYTAGTEGIDKIRVTDTATNAVSTASLTVSPDAELGLYGELWLMPEGSSMWPRVAGGTGHLEMTITSGSSVEINDGVVSTVSTGSTEILVSDKYTGQQANVKAIVASPAVLDAERDNRLSLHRNKGDIVTGFDFNGDGYEDVVLSESESDLTSYESGSVMLYHGTADGFEFTPAWTWPPPNSGIVTAGSSISAGDVNGDGHPDLVVGSQSQTTNILNDGRVDLFLGTASGLSTESHQFFSGTGLYQRFGSAVSLCDLNGDGYDDMVVGVPGFRYNNGITQITPGAVVALAGGPDGLDDIDRKVRYYKEWDGQSWEVVNSMNPSEGVWYQYAMRLATADVNGDGYCDVVASSPAQEPQDTPDTVGEGILLLQLGDPNDLLEPDPSLSIAMQPPPSGIASKFGLYLRFGTLDSTGTQYLAVGAPYRDSDEGEVNAGAMYFFNTDDLMDLTPTTDDSSAAYVLHGTTYQQRLGKSLAWGVIDGIPGVVLGSNIGSTSYPGEIWWVEGDNLQPGYQTLEGFATLIATGNELVYPWAYPNASDLLGFRLGMTDSHIFSFAPGRDDYGLDIGAPVVVDMDGTQTVLDFPGTPAGNGFGRNALYMDIDGNGIDDLVLSAHSMPNGPDDYNVGNLWYCPDGDTSDCNHSLNLDWQNKGSDDQIGLSMDKGDFDGDGDDELIVLLYRTSRPSDYNDFGSAPNTSSCTGYVSNVSVFLIYDTSDFSQPRAVIYGNTSYKYMSRLISGFDFNNDGKDDVMLTGTGLYMVYGQEFSGAATQIICPDGYIDIENDADTEININSIGDLDSDGCDDVAMGNPKEEMVRILWGGGSSCSASTPKVSILHASAGDPFNYGSLLGSGVSGGYDVTGDGITDLVVSDPLTYTNNGHKGRVWVIPGEDIIQSERVPITWGADMPDLDDVQALDISWYTSTVFGESTNARIGYDVGVLADWSNPQNGLFYVYEAIGIQNSDTHGGGAIWDMTPNGDIDPVPRAIVAGETTAGDFGTFLGVSQQNGVNVLLLGAESSDAMNYDEGAVYAFPLEAP